MKKKYYILTLLLLCGISTVWGEGRLKISGKLRVIKPTQLEIKDLKGKTVLSSAIGKDGLFETESIEIVPDVYTLCIGKTEQNIYLENNTVDIKGFFDELHPEKSSLTFTGIDAVSYTHLTLPTSDLV